MSQQRNVKHIALGILLSVTTCVVVCAISVSALLFTEKGRLSLVSIAVNTLHTVTDIRVNIHSLSTPELSVWSFERLTLANQSSTIVDIKNAHLAWQPKQLLQKHLHITKLHAAEINYYPPEQKETPKQKDTAALPTDISAFTPGLNTTVDDVNIQQVNVHHYSLLIDEKSQPIPTLSLTGEIKLHKDAPLYSHLALRSHTAPAFEIVLSISQEPQTQETIPPVHITGTFKEPARGIIGSLAKLPIKQAIDAKAQFVVIPEAKGIRMQLEQLLFPLAKRRVDITGSFFLAKTIEQAEVSDLVVNIDNTQHRISGKWDKTKDAHNIYLKLNASQFPLDVFSPFNLPVQTGQLTGEVIVAGTTTQPTANVNINAVSQYKNLPFSVKAQGNGTRDKIDLKHFTLNLDKGVITAQGKMDITGKQSQLNLSVTNILLGHLQTFGITLPETLEAKLESGQALLTGNILNPDGSLTFQASGSYKQETFQATGQIQKTADDIAIQHSEIILQKKNGKANVSGQINLRSYDANLSLHSRELPLQLLELANIALPDGLIAHLDSDLAIAGHLNKPNIKGAAKLYGHLQEMPFLINAQGGYQNQHIDIDTLTLHAYNEQVLNLEGSLEKGAYDIKLNAQKLPSQLLSTVGWPLPPGEFNAQIHAQGNETSPSFNGEIFYKTKLPGYNDQGRQEDIDFQWTTHIKTEKTSNNEDAFRFTSEFFRNKQPPGQVTIELPAKPYVDYITRGRFDNAPIPTAAILDAKLNAQTISFFLDPEQHRLYGNMNSHLEFKGTRNKIDLKGFINIHDTRYENPITGTIINHIQCVINIEQQTFTMTPCHATDDDQGRYQLSGNITAPPKAQMGAVDITLDADKASLINRPDIESELSGTLRLFGDFSTLTAQGNLDVSPLTVHLVSSSASNIPKIQVERVHSIDESKNANGNTQKHIVPIVNLDIILAAKRQAYLRGRGLEAELVGNIHLKGNLQKPRYDGQFRTVRGVFKVFGKKFTLTEGLVDFANNAISLYVTGEYDKKDQRVIANISGTNEDIKVSLSAEPALPDDEILAFIIFGKAVQNITPVEAIQLATAVQTLRGGSNAIDPIGSARDILKVDTLSIESDTTDSGESGMNVGMGKYLNENVYLEVERTPNPTHPWRGSLEIELTPNISLESSAGGSNGLEGAEIKWKKDY
ncbi:translocation/assembly module TamB domain-containing protein [Teredinibacter sp. KSP-S5-2]|uniref:translocation/assembly module TamB domain-containing protein n=1 Tax=Teredinibacter sp. KSP-S5-2 TaxID=3034506 RepID=UPI0029343A78|nr:translocation/assembly module TamB domain-containing protein [Teredinibacter sp. KSP-S5-2]WNO07818.1 translocation/assembly module TamB [Teredinibacter sp. KSP-S5-2]